MDEQKSLKQTAEEYEVPSKTKNITELSQVSVDLNVEDDSFVNNDGEKVEQKVIVVEGEKYRVPKSVLNALKVILEDNSNLKTFKVKKAGEGMDTRYTVIPLS